MLNFKNNPLSLRLSKAAMISSALPLIFAATSTAAFAQTAENTASVAVPAGVVDSVTGNNSATDSDAIIALITAAAESFGSVNQRASGLLTGRMGGRRVLFLRLMS